MPSVAYAECRKLALGAECRYAKWDYAECHYAQCRGALPSQHDICGQSKDHLTRLYSNGRLLCLPANVIP
jgi:hypothetical protein